jgi:hypothetical protein
MRHTHLQKHLSSLRSGLNNKKPEHSANEHPPAHLLQPAHAPPVLPPLAPPFPQRRRWPDLICVCVNGRLTLGVLSKVNIWGLYTVNTLTFFFCALLVLQSHIHDLTSFTPLPATGGPRPATCCPTPPLPGHTKLTRIHTKPLLPHVTVENRAPCAVHHPLPPPPFPRAEPIGWHPGLRYYCCRAVEEDSFVQLGAEGRHTLAHGPHSCEVCTSVKRDLQRDLKSKRDLLRIKRDL